MIALLLLVLFRILRKLATVIAYPIALLLYWFAWGIYGVIIGGVRLIKSVIGVFKRK
jgi:hypothetical protein